MQTEAKNGTSHTRPILLRIESKAGHGAGKPVTKQIEEFTDVYSFLFWQLGVKPQGRDAPPTARTSIRLKTYRAKYSDAHNAGRVGTRAKLRDSCPRETDYGHVDLLGRLVRSAVPGVA